MSLRISACAIPIATGIDHLVEVTPEQVGWQYVTFRVNQLSAGAVLAGEAAGAEMAIVVLTGRVHAGLDDLDCGEIGGRSSVFTDDPPAALYLGTTAHYTLRCLSSTAEIAIASAPASDRVYPPRLIEPERMALEERGEGTTRRYVRHILDTDQEAGRLIIVEVRTPAGNWSSFPPHKHDIEDPPHEAYLEETYYHHVEPASGFAIQRVYTADGLDEPIAVRDGDLVLVPRGYHPVAAAPGSESYYLNVMAGPHRAWRYSIDPAFRHLAPPSGDIRGAIVAR